MVGGRVVTRRTKAEIAELERQIVAIAAANRPLTLRNVFYRLVVAGMVDKTERGYKQLGDRMVKMRRAGTLPYDWIVDGGRDGRLAPTWENVGDYLADAADWYRTDPWEPAAEIVEVWVESESLAGTLIALCDRYTVNLVACRGFASLSLCYREAEKANARADGRAIRVLYVGDYDPAGVLIPEAAMAEFREHLDVPLHVERIAVTPAQITALALPTKPRKGGERRRLDIEETVEAEAIPVATLRGMVEERIAAALPDGALTDARTAQAEARAAILELAERAP